MTVILKNTSRRLQTFVLAHETYCQARGQCACAVAPGRARRRLPRSLTIPSGVSSHELPDAVLTLPDVNRALARGTISARRVAQPPPLESSKPLVHRAERSAAPQSKRKRGSR